MGNALTITQSSARAVIDWSSFNIGHANTVTFAQPGAASATLNRVSAAAGTSSILGRIESNGAVYLINPNGIAITKYGVVDTRGGFLASSLNISNSDFMGGIARFAAGLDGAPGASVRNAGQIQVGSGSYAALLGGLIANDGTIAAPLGRVALGAGSAATLDFAGAGVLAIELPSVLADSASALSPLLDNTGTITAEGGLVTVRAAAAQSAVRELVNLSGTITATSLTGVKGAIDVEGRVAAPPR